MFRGGGYGGQAPPGPVNLISRGFQAPTGAEPPWKEKKI